MDPLYGSYSKVRVRISKERRQLRQNPARFKQNPMEGHEPESESADPGFAFRGPIVESYRPASYVSLLQAKKPALSCLPLDT